MTTTPGELGILCMAGTGGKPEQRCINPLALGADGNIHWNLYNNRTRAKADVFGVTRRFIWSPGGTKAGTDLALDQWRLLYPDVFTRARATQQFASCFGKGDVAYVGGFCENRGLWDAAGVVEACLAPFLNCDAIGLDATSGVDELSSAFTLACYLAAGEILPLTESMIHRNTAWNSPEFGCVITAEQWKKYRGPADRWPNRTDQKTLLPLDEYQCPLHILCVGDLDTAGTSPTLADVVQMLAAGHSVWVNPTAGKYRGQTAAGIMALVRKVVKA